MEYCSLLVNLKTKMKHRNTCCLLDPDKEKVCIRRNKRRIGSHGQGKLVNKYRTFLVVRANRNRED